jgi:hypothetical protein
MEPDMNQLTSSDGQPAGMHGIPSIRSGYLEKKMTRGRVKDRQRTGDAEDRQAGFLMWREQHAAAGGISCTPNIDVEWTRTADGHNRAASVSLVVPLDVSTRGEARERLSPVLQKHGTCVQLMARYLGVPGYVIGTNRTCTDFMVIPASASDTGQACAYATDDYIRLMVADREKAGGEAGRPYTRSVVQERDYRIWHRRQLGPEYVMTDIDIVEWVGGRKPELVSLVDVTRADAHISVTKRYRDAILERYFLRDIQGRFLYQVAEVTGLPAILVLYRQGIEHSLPGSEELWSFDIRNTTCGGHWLKMTGPQMTGRLHGFAYPHHQTIARL